MRCFDRLKNATGYQRDPHFGPPKKGEVFQDLPGRVPGPERELGWTPKVSLNDGLTKTVEYMRSHLDE